MDNNNIRMILGMKVRELRTRQKWSLQQLAKQTGMSPSYLNEIEKGKKYPKPEKIRELAAALNIDYDGLVSLKLADELNPLGDMLNSAALTKFPFHLFGIDRADIIRLMAKVPRKMSALAGMMHEVASNYDMRVEHFFHTALRAYQVIQRNYFPDLEKSVVKLRKRLGWDGAQLPSLDELRQILTEEHGLAIAAHAFDEDESLRGMRSLFRPPRELWLNPKLLAAQQRFLLARELGFASLGIRERTLTSPALEVSTFDQVFNDFRAAYFAGALLMPREIFCQAFEKICEQEHFDDQAFLSLLDQFGVTPEMLFYRLSELLPQFFRLKRLHFLKFSKREGASPVRLTKRLNMSEVHIPSGISLNEHFCRRWLSVSILDRLEREGKPMVVEAQHSNFLHSKRTFFCISVAYRNHLDPSHLMSLTLGFQESVVLGRKLKFSKAPASDYRVLGQTCERCPLSDVECDQRAAPAHIYENEVIRQRQKTALAKLADQPGKDPQSR